MKKIFISLIIGAAVLTMSSCSKSCHCKTIYNGEVVTENVVDLEDGQKCSDMNASVAILGQKGEVKCVPQLF